MPIEIPNLNFVALAPSLIVMGAALLVLLLDLAVTDKRVLGYLGLLGVVAAAVVVDLALQGAGVDAHAGGVRGWLADARAAVVVGEAGVSQGLLAGEEEEEPGHGRRVAWRGGSGCASEGFEVQLDARWPQVSRTGGVRSPAERTVAAGVASRQGSKPGRTHGQWRGSARRGVNPR